VVWIGVLMGSVETFRSGQQESFARALAWRLGDSCEAVSLVEIADSRADGAGMELLVEIADASGNSSLSTMAGQIEQGVSSGSIGR